MRSERKVSLDMHSKSWKGSSDTLERHGGLGKSTNPREGEEKTWLSELLSSKAAVYRATHMLLNWEDMSMLYLHRGQLIPKDDSEKALLLHSCLMGKGPAWYWFASEEPGRCLLHIRDFLLNAPSDLRVRLLDRVPRSVMREALPILQEVLKDPDAEIRWRAQSALVRTSAHEDIPDLKEMLKSESEGARVAAAEAIAKVAKEEDLPMLRKVLNDPSSNAKRTALLKALARIGHPEDLPLVVDMYTAPRLWFYAGLARAKLMLRDGLPKWSEILMSPASDNTMKSLMVERIMDVGEHVLRDHLMVLKQMLEKGPESARATAARAMISAAVPEDIPVLEKKLADPSEEIRSAVAEAIAGVASTENLRDLKEILDDPDSEGKRKALAILVGRVGTRDDLPIVRRMLGDSDAGVRLLAAEAVGKIGTEDDLNWLAPLAVGRTSEDGAREALLLLDRKLYCPFQ